jgi:magnesium transporter
MPALSGTRNSAATSEAAGDPNGPVQRKEKAVLRFLKHRSRKAGLPPGTPVHIGEEQVKRARVTILDFAKDELADRAVEAPGDLAPFRDRPSVSWINVDGVNDVETVTQVSQQFGLHPLTIEDIVNTDQRPKVEVFDEYLYVVLRMLHYDATAGEIVGEQLSLVLGAGFVLSFQEAPGDVFDPIRDRIRSSKGRVRTAGPDYLLYRLLDAVVDEYFVVLETFGEHIEELEEQLMNDPSPETARIIMELRRELLVFRKAVWPLRELLTQLDRSESGFVSEPTAVFLRDVYDHTIRVSETIDTFRELVASLRDTHMTVISNRMNEVMKVLTIIATIFIPITFIAGVYGMNFKVMPETEWPWSYPIALAVMLGVAVGMIIYFRKKKWL